MQRQNTLFQKIHLEYKEIKHKMLRIKLQLNATTFSNKLQFSENNILLI